MRRLATTKIEASVLKDINKTIFLAPNSFGNAGSFKAREEQGIGLAS